MTGDFLQAEQISNSLTSSFPQTPHLLEKSDSAKSRLHLLHKGKTNDRLPQRTHDSPPRQNEAHSLIKNKNFCKNAKKTFSNAKGVISEFKIPIPYKEQRISNSDTMFAIIFCYICIFFNLLRIHAHSHANIVLIPVNCH